MKAWTSAGERRRCLSSPGGGLTLASRLNPFPFGLAELSRVFVLTEPDASLLHRFGCLHPAQNPQLEHRRDLLGSLHTCMGSSNLAEVEFTPVALTGFKS